MTHVPMCLCPSHIESELALCDQQTILNVLMHDFQRYMIKSPGPSPLFSWITHCGGHQLTCYDNIQITPWWCPCGEESRPLNKSQHQAASLIINHLWSGTFSLIMNHLGSGTQSTSDCNVMESPNQVAPILFPQKPCSNSCLLSQPWIFA